MKLLLATHSGRIVTVELNMKNIAGIYITTICNDQVAYVLEKNSGIAHTYDSARMLGYMRSNCQTISEPKCIYKSFGSDSPQLNAVANHNWELLELQESACIKDPEVLVGLNKLLEVNKILEEAK